MSDAYGNLVVSFSKDFNGDKLALCAVLNEIGYSGYGWSKGDGQFMVEDGEIYYRDTCHHTQYPTVFVERLSGYKLYDEDMMVVEYVSIDDLDEDNYEFFENWEPEMCAIGLSELCATLSKHIKAGSMSLSACATQDAVPWSGVAGADRHRDVRRGPA